MVDEPTSALDKENSDKFMRYLIDAVNRYNMTIIFVTHDFKLSSHAYQYNATR